MLDGPRDAASSAALKIIPIYQLGMKMIKLFLRLFAMIVSWRCLTLTQVFKYFGVPLIAVGVAVYILPVPWIAGLLVGIAAIPFSATAIGFAIDYLFPPITKTYQKLKFENEEDSNELRRQIATSLNDETPNYIIEKCEKGYGITSPEFNAILCASPDIPVHVDHFASWLSYRTSQPSVVSVSKLDRLRRFVVNDALNEGGIVFNSEKIRVASDFRYREVQGKQWFDPVILQQTDYVSSLMTDQLAFQRIDKKDGSDLLTDGLSSFITKTASGKPLLLPLALSRVSNQLGVSTLAFTRDGLLCMVVQSPRNKQSPLRNNRNRLHSSARNTLQ